MQAAGKLLPNGWWQTGATETRKPVVPLILQPPWWELSQCRAAWDAAVAEQFISGDALSLASINGPPSCQDSREGWAGGRPTGDLREAFWPTTSCPCDGYSQRHPVSLHLQLTQGPGAAVPGSADQRGGVDGGSGGGKLGRMPLTCFFL